MIGRRGFITGLISLVAAPAIVRAGSLMPVKGIVMPADPTAILNQWADLQMQRLIWKQQWADVAAFYMPRPGRQPWEPE